MTDGRIHFAGNPWPEGHAIKTFEWTARQVDGRVWFDLHLVTQDYYAEREIEDDEDVEYASDWEAPIVWGNYHACILSSTYWDEDRGFDACDLADFSPAWLDGRRFEVDPVEGEIDDVEALAFHIYLLGHDSAVDHRIEFSRIGDSDRFDIVWSGRIALTYAGNYHPEHRFEARIRGVPFPRIAVSAD